MKRKILIVGDSHTQALGPRVKQMFQDDDVFVYAFPGFSTARILAAMDRSVLYRTYDLTIVAAGGNDFGDRAAARLELLRELRNSKQILWVGPAFASDNEVNMRHVQQADSQEQQFARLHVPWFDSYSVTTSGHVADGVHFKPEAYDVWAEAIADEAKWLLGKRSFTIATAWAGVVGVTVWIFRKTLGLGK